MKMKLEKIKFITRLIFYLLVLSTLLYILFREGVDPCDRCRFKVEAYGDEEVTARELIEDWALKCFPIESNVEMFNTSDYNFTYG